MSRQEDGVKGKLKSELGLEEGEAQVVVKVIEQYEVDKVNLAVAVRKVRGDIEEMMHKSLEINVARASGLGTPPILLPVVDELERMAKEMDSDIRSIKQLYRIMNEKYAHSVALELGKEELEKEMDLLNSENVLHMLGIDFKLLRRKN